MAQTLTQRIRSHNRGQRTSGQNTLTLFVESVDHMMGPSGDWTPLAWMADGEPAQSKKVRDLAGRVLQGWKFSKVPEAKAGQPGWKLSKVKGHNQGFDTDELDKVRALVAEKKSIQSDAVKDLVNDGRVIKVLTVEEFKVKDVKRVEKLMDEKKLTPEEVIAIATANIEAAKAWKAKNTLTTPAQMPESN